MSNKTNANNNASNNNGKVAEVEVHQPQEVAQAVVEALNNTQDTPAEVTEVKAESKLKAAKGKLRTFNFWHGVAGAAIVAGVGNAANMLVCNKLIDSLETGDTKYTTLEVVGTSLAAAAISGTVQGAIQAVSDRVTFNDVDQMVTMSMVANGTVIGTAFLRDKALNAIRGTIDTPELLSEEEIAEA